MGGTRKYFFAPPIGKLCKHFNPFEPHGGDLSAPECLWRKDGLHAPRWIVPTLANAVLPLDTGDVVQHDHALAGIRDPATGDTARFPLSWNRAAQFMLSTGSISPDLAACLDPHLQNGRHQAPCVNSPSREIR